MSEDTTVVQEAGHGKVVVVTGASSGFGDLTARALARAGHTVHAGTRAIDGRNAPRAAELVTGVVHDDVESARHHRIGIDGLLPEQASR